MQIEDAIEVLLSASAAKSIGLNISTDLPLEIFALIDCFRERSEGNSGKPVSVLYN